MPPDPIETALQQIKDGVAFAKSGGDTITPQKQDGMGYNLMQSTGRFTTECEKWRKKATTDKTWGNLNTLFKAANPQLQPLQEYLRLGDLFPQVADEGALDATGPNRDGVPEDQARRFLRQIWW